MSEGKCIGWANHRWTLSIDEGKPSVSTEPCWEGCAADYGIGDNLELLTMAPIPVRVEMATECPAYPTDDGCVPTGAAVPMRGYESGSHYIAHGSRCDCNWWPVLRPVTA